jgi:hypothetical protein
MHSHGSPSHQTEYPEYPSFLLHIISTVEYGTKYNVIGALYSAGSLKSEVEWLRDRAIIPKVSVVKPVRWSKSVVCEVFGWGENVACWSVSKVKKERKDNQPLST